MARKAQLTDSLPKLAVSPEMRQRVQKVADAAEVGMADIQRDGLALILPLLEVQYGLGDWEDEIVTEADVVREDRAAGCFGR